MVIYTVVGPAAASCPVGTDLLNNSWISTNVRNRVLTKVGLVGSAVLQDASVEIVCGPEKLATLYPTTVAVTVPVADKDMLPCEGFIGRNNPLQAIVTKAPTTNPLVLCVHISSYVRKSLSGAQMRRLNQQGINVPQAPQMGYQSRRY